MHKFTTDVFYNSLTATCFGIVTTFLQLTPKFH